MAKILAITRFGTKRLGPFAFSSSGNGCRTAHNRISTVEFFPFKIRSAEKSECGDAI
jgi:hypothetical protein